MKEAEKKKSFGDYKICGDVLLCKTPICVDFFVNSIHYIYCILYMREFRIFSPARGGCSERNDDCQKGWWVGGLRHIFGNFTISI